jgi:hypothetical protein
MDIKQIKADLRQKLGDGYEVIIKEKATKQMREKTQKEIKEIQDLILKQKIDLTDKVAKIAFLKKMYSEGYSVIALKSVLKFKSHTNLYYYLKK